MALPSQKLLTIIDDFKDKLSSAEYLKITEALADSYKEEKKVKNKINPYLVTFVVSTLQDDLDNQLDISTRVRIRKRTRVLMLNTHTINLYNNENIFYNSRKLLLDKDTDYCNYMGDGGSNETIFYNKGLYVINVVPYVHDPLNDSPAPLRLLRRRVR